MPQIALQSSMFGPPTVCGDIVARIEALLIERPELRDSYAALKAAYWAEYDGLGDALKRPLVGCVGEPEATELASALVEAFQLWFEKFATSGKTIQNRAMECQRNNPQLDASRDIRKWRDKQSRAGPIR